MQCEVCGLQPAIIEADRPAIIEADRSEQRCSDCTQFREALDATVGELLLDANAGGIPPMVLASWLAAHVGGLLHGAPVEHRARVARARAGILKALASGGGG